MFSGTPITMTTIGSFAALRQDLTDANFHLAEKDGGENVCTSSQSKFRVGFYFYLIFLKLPPYAPAVFDLTT
jgi:hypothetical protein